MGSPAAPGDRGGRLVAARLGRTEPGARPGALSHVVVVELLFAKGEEPGKHYDVAALPTRQARDRLDELRLSDMTRISRLRLGGPLRLYGFLEDNCFHIVWWDPKHTVWPSKKKGT